MMIPYINLLLVILQFVFNPVADKRTYVTRIPVAIDTALHKGIKEKFGYDFVYPVRAYVGGLEPRLPMMIVETHTERQPSLFYHNGYRRTWSSLVVETRKGPVLLDSEEKFRKMFAPIRDEQEAISYVAFLTGTEPWYDIEHHKEYRNYTSEFPSAYAYRIRDGFVVLLHHKSFSGCGPHPSFYIRYRVSRKGLISEMERVRMFEDPEEDRICVD